MDLLVCSIRLEAANALIAHQLTCFGVPLHAFKHFDHKGGGQLFKCVVLEPSQKRNACQCCRPHVPVVILGRVRVSVVGCKLNPSFAAGGGCFAPEISPYVMCAQV